MLIIQKKISDLGFFYVISSLGVTKFEWSSLFSVLFYLNLTIHMGTMMLMLGDTLLLSITETLKFEWRNGGRRMIVAAAICLIGLISSFCLVTTVSHITHMYNIQFFY